MFRNPYVAGQFYYLDPEMLREDIEKHVDKNAKKEDVLGVVVPHAGHMYSGKVAGMVYSRINFPDTFVVMGPNHTGVGRDYAMMKDGIWRMPFGEVRIDKILAEKIFVNSKHLEDDYSAHIYEHSIEVQIPFMQYFSDKFQIVPIVLSGYPNEHYLKIYQEIGKEIGKAIKQVKEKVVIAASSDLTHYETEESARKKDHEAINAILNLDEAELFKKISELQISMCGFASVAVMLSACKELGAKKAELVKYATSGDVYKSREVVGYAGILIK